MIDKNLERSFQIIDELNQNHSFKVQVGKTKNNPFNNRELTIKQNDTNYSYITTIPIKKGLQKEKEVEIKRETEIYLKNRRFKYCTKGKYIIPNSISYVGFDTLKIEKQIEGHINYLSNRKSSYYKKNRCYRILIPIKNKVRITGDFTGLTYSMDGRTSHETLMNLKILKNEYHFYYALKTKENGFFVIDCLSKQPLETFQKVTYSILLIYAFLKGNLYGGKAYILTYSRKYFKDPISILSTTIWNNILNGFAIHTTNPLALVQIQNKLRYRKDKSGNIIGTRSDFLKKYMVEFPSESYSKLCTLTLNHGGILRAITFIVQNHIVVLELKVPTLYVALENLTKALTGGDKSTPKIIDDSTIINEIQTVIKTTIKEISGIAKKNKPQNLKTEEEKDYSANFERIKSKLLDFNQGSNNKKLLEPFKKIGYTLTKEEEDLILISRNKFLHGDNVFGSIEDFDLEFKYLFHISLRLQKLLAILLLKSTDFSGYILNNAKIYDYITEKKLKEYVFIKI